MGSNTNIQGYPLQNRWQLNGANSPLLNEDDLAVTPAKNFGITTYGNNEDELVEFQENNITLDINKSLGISKKGDFQNKFINTKKAEQVNADLFDGPVVTLSGYEQNRILNSGFINDIEGYKLANDGNYFVRINSDNSKEFLRVVNDNGNYKIIHTIAGDDINNTEVFSLDRKDVSNFIMPENFQGLNKNSVKYDNIGNYHILASSDMKTVADIIRGVYGVSPTSEEGQIISDAILSKNKLLGIENASSIIETGKDIILVDKEEIDALCEAKSDGDLFNSNISLTKQYVNDGNTIPYLLLGPENPDPDVEYPVIVYLHGDGLKGKSESAMYIGNTPGGFMNELDLDNFNGYVICPHLTGNYYQKGWDDSKSEQYIRDLINNFSQTHNIDSDRIALTGASRGGMGTIYLANKMEDVFCSAAALSGYPTGVQPKDINIPIRGYVGKAAYGEDVGSVNYMTNTFGAQLGSENLITLDASHSLVAKTAFGQDLDGDNRSDLIQWLFSNNTGGNKNITPSYFKQSEPVYPTNVNMNDGEPVSLNEDIRNVNWAQYGYNAEVGNKFASSAANVEDRLREKNISTTGNCLGGVKDTFIDVTGYSPFGLPNQDITVASNCAGVMENLEEYREITNISVDDLKYLPAGAIIVWSSSTTGDNAADKYGHISISLGDGRESSATVVNQYTKVGKNGKPRVFIPI